eukprot:c39340_g1_i1 orf=298-450(+)
MLHFMAGCNFHGCFVKLPNLHFPFLASACHRPHFDACCILWQAVIFMDVL